MARGRRVATSAGICEETGFRGYIQRPIEQGPGAPIAIFVSSLLFMLLHLTKGWALPGMIPVVFGAGVLLGLLAWSSGSLIPGMIGHTSMDIGLFGYWWTGLAGDFTARPISETGIDQPFLVTCAALTTTLLVVLFAIWQLRRITRVSRESVLRFVQIDRLGASRFSFSVGGTRSGTPVSN